MKRLRHKSIYVSKFNSLISFTFFGTIKVLSSGPICNAFLAKKWVTTITLLRINNYIETYWTLKELSLLFFLIITALHHFKSQLTIISLSRLEFFRNISKSIWILSSKLFFSWRLNCSRVYLIVLSLLFLLFLNWRIWINQTRRSGLFLWYLLSSLNRIILKLSSFSLSLLSEICQRSICLYFNFFWLFSFLVSTHIKSDRNKLNLVKI